MSNLRPWLLVTLALLIYGRLFADTTGKISGSVTDPSGAAVVDSSVVLTNTQTGIEHSVVTDEQGVFNLLAIQPGTYTLQVRHAGFQTYQQTGVVIDVNSALQVEVKLAVGSVDTTVAVAADAVQVETVNTQVGDVIESRKLDALPLNGRSYTDLLGLQPGVVPVSTGSVGGVPNPTPGTVSVSGQRESSNGFQVNGGNVEFAQTHGAAIVPNLDSIAEFRLLTNGFDAEYGNYSGGLVNAITKSGTNEFHGNGFGFFRNEALDARNFYDATKGAFSRQQFGGTGGGPIKKDKIFFFLDYQGTREFRGVSSGNVLVPNGNERNGIFTDAASSLTGTVAGPYWAQTLSNRLGYPVSEGEPYYAAGCSSPSTCVFPNGVIPKSAWAKPVSAYLPLIPMPNNGDYFVSSSNNRDLRDDKMGARLDANTRIGTITGYYYFDDSSLLTPYGANSVPGFPTTDATRAHEFNLSDTKTFGATMVNEFRFNITRYVPRQGYPAGNQLGKGKISAAGFVNLVPDQPSLEALPSIGLNTFGLGYPFISFYQPNTAYEWQDNLSKVIGAHTAKFGFNLRKSQVGQRFPVAPNGVFGFDGSETGNDFADFLIGAPVSYAQQSIVIADERSTYYGLYAQDSWRIRPTLTINYGIRFESSQPWWDTQNRTSTVVAGQQSKVIPNAPLGLVFPGDPGIPKTIAPTQYKWAPRIGMAWAPSNKTSVRAGFGIFNQTVEGTQTYWTTGEAPFAAAYYNLLPPSFDNPFQDRSTGKINRSPFPFSPPPPGSTFDWSPYLPIDGYPFFSKDNVLPYAIHYNFSVQREVARNSIATVAYVGTQGHHLPASVASNPSDPALCLGLSSKSQVAPGSPTCGPRGENQVFTRANGQIVNGTRAPFGMLYGDNAIIETIANSAYNSLELSLRHNSTRLNLLAGYTWSKSIDNASGMGSSYLNPTNYRLSRALSAFDVRHNFVASFDYQLPFDQIAGGARSRLAAGWRLVGVVHALSGLPVTLGESDDRSLYGSVNGGTGARLDLPDYTGAPLSFKDPRTALPYFNTAAFTKEPLGHIGNASRRFFYGPGDFTTDLSLLKDLRITERTRAEFRAEFFNVFNHANFNNPQGNINNRNFGRVTTARDPRIGQLAVKFYF